MSGWYIRPSSQGQHILTWSTDSVSSSTSTLLGRLAKLSTMVVVMLGAGMLYCEYLHRLKLIERQEARQRRLLRKLLEKQKINTHPVPIFDMKKSRDKERRQVPDYRPLQQQQIGHREEFPPTLVSRTQLCKVWGDVPPAKQVREARRIGQEKWRHVGERKGRGNNMERGDPDGGELEMRKAGDINILKSDDLSMDKVIESAKEARRLIRNISTDSLNHYNTPLSKVETGKDNISEYSEEDLDCDYLSKTTSDFRELLQLTSIDDPWSDTGSIRHSSVISYSPPREKRRRSVLSCNTEGSLDLDSWDWEDEDPKYLEVKTSQSMDLVIKCGEIVTSDTRIMLNL